MLGEQFAHQSFSCLGVSAAWNDNIQNEAILIHGTPKPMFLALDAYDDFIQVPFVIAVSRRSITNFPGKLPPEFLSPSFDRLVGDDDPSLCQQVLNHPQAQWELKIQPNGMGDHVGWKSVAVVHWGIHFAHAAEWHIFKCCALTSRYPYLFSLGI